MQKLVETRVLEMVFTCHTPEDEEMGRVWWDGKEIQSDSPALIDLLKSATIGGLTFDDGARMLRELPQHFRGSYITVKRAE